MESMESMEYMEDTWNMWKIFIRYSWNMDGICGILMEYIWVNYEDFTATSLEMMILIREIIPFGRTVQLSEE